MYDKSSAVIAWSYWADSFGLWADCSETYDSLPIASIRPEFTAVGAPVIAAAPGVLPDKSTSEADVGSTLCVSC